MTSDHMHITGTCGQADAAQSQTGYSGAGEGTASGAGTMPEL